MHSEDNEPVKRPSGEPLINERWMKTAKRRQPVQQISVWLDKDVIEYFSKNGTIRHKAINDALRRSMVQESASQSLVHSWFEGFSSNKLELLISDLYEAPDQNDQHRYWVEFIHNSLSGAINEGAQTAGAKPAGIVMTHYQRRNTITPPRQQAPQKQWLRKAHAE
ncbi:hypothetical protein [uncultured Hyphomonas sp.]|uniref:hypothetical protein n=1 Tax=uncultured Hyphomonas sp. TaxID=225298 RepID=UPI002AAB89BB|nr:hypothetical protein [uncultured Hyphomonas sp.]